MYLKELLLGVDYSILKGNEEIDIENIQYDSRKIEKGDLFFAIQGYNADGHKFIPSAIKNGAIAIVCDEELDSLPECTVIKVKDSRKAMANISSNFFQNPKDRLKIMGVTGTNGKTTSTFMLKAILEEAGYKVGLLGTIANYIGDKKINSSRTTPESLEIHKLFKEMVENGVEYCVMEVSSHSLYLDRVYGIEFSEAIFTNLTQDHLDFHKTFENYYNAKLILFNNSKNSIVNIDDKYGNKVLKDVDNNKYTYSISSKADLLAEDIEMSSKGIKFIANFKGIKQEIIVHIPGKYNVSNALGCILACLNENISMEVIQNGLRKLNGVPGRCEIVTKDYDLGYEVIVDYAHTPDGLENILKTAREFTKCRLISVFGCGGDRDKTKRSIMGNIGSELSDIAIITSDNPRTEDPLTIIEDVKNGIKDDNYLVIENRRDAIKKAMSIARKDDVVVVAGKGHEDYQILKDKTIHFDEREIIKEIIDELHK